MPRRRALGWSLLILLTLAACQPAKAPRLLPPPPTPMQTLRVALPALPAETDPALTPAYDSGLDRVGFEALLKPKPDLSDVRQAAAASYEVSPDGLTYTFHLQPRGAWSDGTPVRAADFVLGWRRILDPRVNSPLGDLLSGWVRNAAQYGSLDPKKDSARIPAFLDGLGLKAVDNLTFTVQLDRPAPGFKWVATIPALAPARSDNPANGPRIGNGPFQLQSASRRELVLEPNAHYWAGRPKLDRLVLALRGDAAADLARFRSGKEELTTVAGGSASEVEKDPVLAAEVVKVPRLEEVWAQFNVHSAPFDNALVRLAFAQAIDRDQLLPQLAATSLPSVGLLPRGLRGYRPELAAQQFDPSAARATLAASGVPSAALAGIHLLVRDLPEDRTLAAFIAAQVKANLGVDVALDVRSSPEVTKTLQDGHFQLQAPAGWLTDYPEDQDFADLFRTENFSQWSRYSSPGYDRLVTEGDAEPDLTRRAQLYAQAQQLLVEDAPAAFLYQPVSWNLKQPTVEGVTYTPADDWPGDVYAADISIANR